jgi:hypothetical protein
MSDNKGRIYVVEPVVGLCDDKSNDTGRRNKAGASFKRGLSRTSQQLWLR